MIRGLFHSIVLLALFLAQSLSAVAQESATMDDQAEESIYSIRRIFLPEADLQKVIQGRFLPLELSKLNELLAQADQKETLPILASSQWHLEWDSDVGLRGYTVFEFESELDGGQYLFDSEFKFSNLRCLDNLFAISSIGATPEFKKSLSSVAGKQFRCDVALPVSNTLSKRTLQIPNGTHRRIFLKIPSGYRVLSNAQVVPRHMARQQENEVGQYFELSSLDSQIQLSIIDDLVSSDLITGRDSLQWNKELLIWNSSVTLPPLFLSKNDNTIWANSDFECQSITLRGQEVEFVATGTRNGRTGLRLEVAEISGEELNLKFEFQKRLPAQSSVSFTPLYFGEDQEQRSELDLVNSSDWNIESIELDGYVVADANESTSIRLVQTNLGGTVGISATRFVESAETKMLELDFQNGELWVRQLVEKLQPQTVLKAESSWEIQSVIDVLQDELPVPFMSRKKGKEQLLIMENESSTAWVVASKKIDSVQSFQISDFLPVNVGSEKTLVQFKSGFLGRFSGGIESPNGVPSPSIENGAELFPFSRLTSLRFQMATDIRQFESSFESVVDVDLASNHNQIKYAISWDAGESRQLIVELNSKVLNRVAFQDLQGGVYKRLTTNEKRRLALSESRQYWMFEIGAGNESRRAQVAFALDGEVSDSFLNVQLPQAIGSSRSNGLLRVRNGAVSFQLENDSFAEFTSNSDEGLRLFQFGNQRSVRLLLEEQSGESQASTVQVLQCRTSFLDQRRFVQEIELVYQTDQANGPEELSSFLTLRSDDATIKKVTLHQDQMYFSGVASDQGHSEWHVGIPATQKLTRAILEIAAIRKADWSLAPLTLPTIELNGNNITQRSTVIAGNQHRIVDLQEFLNWNPVESFKNLTWLLSFSLDSETSKQMGGIQLGHDSVILDQGQTGSLVFLLPERVITLLSIVCLTIFGLMSLTLKRNRHVLYACLFFLLFVFLFGGIYGLLSAMGFWGCAIGMIIRELRRLCRFSSMASAVFPAGENSVVQTGLVFVFLLGFSNCSLGQSGTGKDDKNGAADNPKKVMVPALIPLDKNQKPTGIVYLPAKAYEELSKSKRSVGPLICQNTSLEILASTDAKSLSGNLQFELEFDRPRRLTLPLSIAGAIFDSNAVTIDDEPVAFRPVNVGKALEFDVPKAGRLRLQVRFQVPLSSKMSVDMMVPFGDAVSVTNRSGVPYSVRNSVKGGDANKSSTNVVVDANETKMIPATNRVVLSPGSLQGDQLDVIEIVDFTQDSIKRSIIVSARSPLAKPLRFTVGKKVNLTANVDGLTRENGSFIYVGEGKRQFRFEVEETIGSKSGMLEFLLLETTTHIIEKRLLLFKSGEKEFISSLPELSSVDLEANWGSVGASVNLDEYDLAVEPKDDKFLCWRSPESFDLSCLAEHHFFLAKNKVFLKSELDLSSDSAIPVFSIKISNGLRKMEFRLGQKKLRWIRIGRDHVLVFSNLNQPGRYLVELSAEFYPNFNDLWLVEPAVQAESNQSRSYIHTNRERRIIGKLPEMLASGTNSFTDVSDVTSDADGFILIGSLDGEINRLPSKLDTGFNKVQVREELKFLPGKTTHRVVVKLPKYQVGQWLGVELPRNAVLTDEQKSRLKEEQSIIENANVLASTQIWVPLIKSGQKEVLVEFDQPLEGNRVEFAKFLNAGSITRRVYVPNAIGNSRLSWTFEDGRVAEESEDGTEWVESRNDSSASYVLEAGQAESLKVHFAETAIDESAQILNFRFYVSPGDKRDFVFKLPENQVVETIQVCGSDRDWEMKQGREIHVSLLNNRFFQVVDVVVYVSGQSVRQQVDITVPAVPNVDQYPVYFQNFSKMEVADLEVVESSSLRHLRMEFVKQAVNNFELNLDKGESWLGVLNSWIKSVQSREPMDEDLESRLSNVRTGNRFENHVYAETRPNPCLLTMKIYELDSGTIQLVQAKAGSLGPIQLRILASILVMVVVAVMTARLPYWFRAPVFSFALISLIWIFGVTWIALTPESIFAWCWMIFAVLFVCLVIIDAVLKLRAYVSGRNSRTTAELGDGLSTTQLNAGRTSN